MRNRIDEKLRRLIDVLATAQAYLYRAQAVPVWTCADGRVMPITEMYDNHLHNAIRLIERNAPHAAKRAPILPALKAEEERRRRLNMWRQAKAGAPVDWKHDPKRLADLERRAECAAINNTNTIRRCVNNAGRLSQLEVAKDQHEERLRKLEEKADKPLLLLESGAAEVLAERTHTLHDKITLLQHEVDKRLTALEAWTHKPVPVVTIALVRDALFRVHRRWVVTDWRAKFVRQLAFELGIDQAEHWGPGL